MSLPGQFTAGISYRSQTWGIDYAYIGHAQFLGSSHRISASWRFGESFLGKVKSFIPEGVNAYVDGDIITLRWNNSPSLSLAGYNVYFSKTTSSGYVKINQKPIKTNYYSLRGLEKNTHYYFVVSSVTNTIPPVESQYSREVLAGTTSAPGAPVVVQSEIQNEGVIDIAKQEGLAGWPDPAKSGLKGYNVYYSEVSGGRFDKVNAQPIANVPTYLVRKLKVGQRYYFTFTSVSNDGTESAHSKEVSAVALPYSSIAPGAR
jgi:fibronectin type 3 domain-containing protein